MLLIDETDKADIEIEGLLLEVLSDFAVTVPELGTIKAERAPFVLLTSNATRELSEALKRRCLFLHIDFPDPDLERRILLSRVPELPEHLAEELVRIIGVLRGMQLKKVPSVAETIDWGRTILALGMDTIDDDADRRHTGRGAQAPVRPDQGKRRAPAQLGDHPWPSVAPVRHSRWPRTAFPATWWSSSKRYAGRGFRWVRRRPSTPAG